MQQKFILIVQEARIPKSRCGQDWFPMKAKEETIFASPLASGGGWQPRAFFGCGHVTGISAFIVRLLFLCLCVSSSLRVRTLVIRFRDNPNLVLLSKGMHGGSGCLPLKASKQDRVVERKVSFISDVSNWGGECRHLSKGWLHPPRPPTSRGWELLQTEW